MSITLAHLERLKRTRKIYGFLQKGNTGNPAEFAKRLSISVRTLREDLNIIKEWGGKVGYNRKDQTYYYQEQFDVHIHFEVVVLCAAEQRKIYGGYSPSFLEGIIHFAVKKHFAANRLP